MQNNFNTILTGILGVSTVEVTEVVAQSVPTPEEVSSIGQLLIQIVIGIVTVWKLIKKPKKDGNKD